VTASLKKFKIFNDPLYGFISVPEGLIFELIDNPWFQRLRRIQQLGLTNMVYSGANHTRFQHALGAFYLMQQAIDTLSGKGVEISEEESEAAFIAILLHDIGHGPFSHTLEHCLLSKVHHETLSTQIMHALNNELGGALKMAISIYEGTYSKKFLHQLVSSQLDMDRMDYLMRDSFFTGVSEGVIGSDRIIKMLNVVDDQLVVEAKGIYSIEKFLIARRLMYWQVYLHKTVVAAEFNLIRIIDRARELLKDEIKINGSDPLLFFLKRKITISELKTNPEALQNFLRLDDHDVLSAVKSWTNHSDYILRNLSINLINRRLNKIYIHRKPFSRNQIDELESKLLKHMPIEKEDAHYFVYSDRIQNRAYSQSIDEIFLMKKDTSLVKLTDDADLLNISVLSEPVVKYFLTFPKFLLK
jgi:HD superfamily phosphohydrolase